MNSAKINFNTLLQVNSPSGLVYLSCLNKYAELVFSKKITLEDH